MDNDLISVIVPLYNSGKYVAECIESLINQTYKNIEIILVDDGSTDNAGMICDEYAKKDNRIIVIHKENSGAADSRNRGLDVAKGKYIHFSDSDDVENERILEFLHKELVSNDADMVYTDFVKFYNEEEAPVENITDYSVEEHDKYEILKKYYDQGHNHEITVIPTCKLFKRELFDNVRFPSGRKGEDELTNYKLIYKANRIIEIKAVLYYYRRYPGTLSSDWRTKPRHYMVEAFKEELDYFNNVQDKKVIPLVVKRLIDELEHNYQFGLPETEIYGKQIDEYSSMYANYLN